MEKSGLLTVKQVAERLGVSKFRIYRRILRGDLRAMRSLHGRVRYLVDPVDLDSYIAAGGTDNLTAPALTHDENMVGVSEVALMTGLTPESIRALCYAGKLPYVRGTGGRRLGHLRIPRDAAEGLVVTRPSS